MKRLSLLTVAGMGISAAMWLSSKQNRIKAQNIFNDLKSKVKPSTVDFEKNKNHPVEKGGNPQPYDLRDNQMVSEGAMYSVKFYNENMQ
ncbi:hypothetical protein [Metabacillus fastidiosus]|uniref:hypothetical protein n=1 Tax=Metabacillus fastidiosus TaxID=1458 RepID=UPI002DBA3CB4|nr:hypothetical protein [Metabacillus fastidiosus]MEC2078054.1 hypothetical protein [Metabacillus fastidiosus]